MNRLRSRGCRQSRPSSGLGSTPIWPVRSSGRLAAPAGSRWAIGSLRQGQLFESAAVPNRLQAQDVAALLLAKLRSFGPGYALLEAAPRATNY